MGKTKNLLIIGGAGFIGRHLATQAVRRGYNTTILSLHHVDKSRCIDGANYFVADVTKYGDLKNFLANKLFSYVVNLGGYISHSKYKNGGREILDAHFLGVQNLVELLNWDILKTFVQIGSSDEYGDAHAPQCEDFREMPISSYSLGKLAASQFLQMLYRTEKFPAVILRLFLVYGAGQNNQRFLPQIIQGCLKGESFATSDGQQLRDFCYIDDIVKGIILALENSEVHGEIINLASGIPVKIRSVLEQVVNITGNGSPLYGEVSYRVGENMSLYADITKARKILCWLPETSLSDGLARTVDYYINNQM